MAILDTFYTLFKTNADEAKKGFNEAEKAVGSFGASMTKADEHVHAAGERIAETFVEIGGAIAAAFAFEHVKEFIENTIEINAHLQQTSERIGVAVEDLAALQAAATRFGGSADGVTGSLDFLNRGLADIAVKGTSRLKPFFDELKINVLASKGHVKDLTTVLGELADKMQGKTAQERAGLGERFALDPGLLLAMADGRRGLEDLITREKELGVTTAEDAEASEKFEQKMADLRLVFGHVGNEIVTGILPLFGAMVDGVMEFVHFLENHKALVEGFFIGVGGVIAAFYTQAVIKAAWATAIWLAELLWFPALIAAVIAAFAFLYDDIQNFLKGNKSVIGELSKSWPIVGETVREVAKDIAESWAWIKALFSGGGAFIKGVASLIAASFGAVSKSVTDWAKGFATAYPNIAAGLKAIGEVVLWITKLVGGLIGGFAKMAGAFGSDFLKSQIAGLKALPAALAAAGGGSQRLANNITGGPAPAYAQAATPWRPAPAPAPVRFAQLHEPAPAQAASQEPHPTVIADTVARGKEQVATATATPLGAIGRAGDVSHTVNRSTKVTIENVTVQTQASDPQAVAGAVGDTLADHVRKAINQHDDGVAM